VKFEALEIIDSAKIRSYLSWKDLHWVDPSTLDLSPHWHPTRPAKLLVLATYRPLMSSFRESFESTKAGFGPHLGHEISLEGLRNQMSPNTSPSSLFAGLSFRICEPDLPAVRRQPAFM